MTGSSATPDDVTPTRSQGNPPAAIACDICQRPMYDFHCRLICSNCGFQRDCSDP